MRRLTIIAALIAVVSLWSSPAFAARWTDPDITRLSGTLVPGETGGMVLPWTVIWQLDTLAGSPMDPRAVERLANGNTLITSRDPRGVYEVDADGAIVWSYTADNDPVLTPFHATRTSSGTTLIVDRWRPAVFEVDTSGAVIWQYTDLYDPIHATRLPNGNTLITESLACRVIEVRSSDYDPGVPGDGYGPTSVVWTYGVTGEPAGDHDYGEPYLQWPKYAQRLANGNTLIADEGAHRVLEVTPAKAVAWTYGVPGVAGAEAGYLDTPAAAERAADGSTIITDGGNDRVVRVGTGGDIVWQFSATNLLGLDDIGLLDPRRAQPTPSGSILIADGDNDRLIEIGRLASGTGISAPTDCGLPGARKQFTRLAVTALTPEGTESRISYSIDGGAWRNLAGISFPAGTYGTAIRYRVTLETERLDVTPTAVRASIDYEPAPEQAAEDSGSGSGSSSGGSGSGASGRTRRSSSWAQRSVLPGTTTDTKRSPGGYASGDSAEAVTSLGGLGGTYRGWEMGVVSDTTLGSGPPGSAAPRPPTRGLLLLVIVYAFGAVSVPAWDIIAEHLPRLRPAS
ncbi:MAG: hypothetical protein ISP10_04055 [Aeromicrobium sp.]|nr:hypothetical protein [Aeromicrobium sp.]